MSRLARAALRSSACQGIGTIALRSAVLSCPRRNFSTAPSANAQNVKNISVYGSGLMGAGIVQVAAQHGFSVTMVDLKDEYIAKGKKIIESSLKTVARKTHKDDEVKQKALIDSTWANIQTTTDTRAAAENADLVVEAIVEKLDIKRNLFSELDKVAPRETIFASNTSSLPIGEIASATARLDKFAGLHFFNPVPLMKLVEVIRTDKTSQDTYDTLMGVTKKMSKTPVTCKDTPGFIVNRLLVPYLLEAVHLVERGDATIEDVDQAMKAGAGMPMGPFTLSDFVGLDTLKSIIDGWRESGRVEPALVATSKMLDDLVAKGQLGKKTGKGFYTY